MDAITGLEQVEKISSCDLREVAERALGEGKEVLFERRGAICTIVIGARAGQSTSGDAIWGEWSADEEMIYLDEEGKDESGARCQVRADLDGRQECF